MTRRAAIALLTAIAVAFPVVAQDEGEGTRLERLLEDALSGAGRDVTVRGFRGALSGRAEMDSLTIADGEGEWLILSDAVLDWNRAALLRGRLEVAELSADRIEVLRRPAGEGGDGFQPEASGTALQLPDLPVAVDIGDFSAETLVLGAPVLGTALTASLEGRAIIDDGDGQATLSLVRTDGPRGEISLDGSFSNESGLLSLDLLFDEAAGGIVASRIGLPGAPALRLKVVGEGPLADFSADVALSTEGSERLGGTVATRVVGERRLIDVNLAGDLRPMTRAEVHPFFGPRTEVTAGVIIETGGDVRVENLALSTGATELSGTLVIGPDGLPRRIELDGTLAAPDATSVVLPLPGPETRIAAARVSLSHNVTEGPEWRALLVADNIERAGFRVDQVRLDGFGTIETDPARISAAFDFAATSLDLAGEAVQDALGEDVTGRAELEWSSGNALNIGVFEIAGETYSAAASGSISNATTTLDLDGTVSASADDLSAFSGLAGRPLDGRVSATLTGRGGVFSGLVDVRGGINGQELRVGEPRLDPYLSGATATEIAIRRTTEGIFLDAFRITGRNIEANVTGQVSSEGGSSVAALRLGDISPLADGLSGPASLVLTANLEDKVWTWALEADAMSIATEAEGTLVGAVGRDVAVTATGRVVSPDLSPIGVLVGRPIGGGADVTFAARAEPSGGRYSWTLEGMLDNPQTGLDDLDTLLGGPVDLATSGALEGDALSVERLDLSSNLLTMQGSGAWAPDFRGFAVDAGLELTDISIIGEGLAGPLVLSVTVEPEGENGPWASRLNLTADSASVSAEGLLRDLSGTPQGAGRIALDLSDLSLFAPVLSRPIAGALSATAEGEIVADLSRFDVAVSGEALNAGLGIPALDRVLRGVAEFSVDAARGQEGIIVRTADLTTPLLTADAAGVLGDDTAFEFSARLADIAPFVDGFSGPVTARGRALPAEGERINVEAALTGVAGATANVAGTTSADGQDLDLSIDGQAPLGLINGIIAPRAVSGTARFDLAMTGPPELSSLSGRITTSGAVLTAPLLNVALDNLGADVALSAGQARIDASGAFRDGGRLDLDGSTGLSGDLPADLDLVLTSVRLTDPNLYQTIVDARLAITGPLTDGALISGRVDVGPSELQIPSVSGAGSGGLPDLTHIDEPAEVRATRARAGLLETAGNGREAGADYRLDIVVDAPNRIFIRGRGLDAELGGRVRLAGTTADVAPAGRFDLIRGRLDILGRRLNMTQGTIDLTGALVPRIRLVAETGAEDVDISIIVEGPASDPDIIFTSRPDLPEDEILSLLLFGRGIETLSPLQVARLAAAVATLRSPGGGLLGSVREGAGLADLDVTSGENGGAAVRAGTYIGENVYTDVTIDTEGEAEINLNLDLSDSITVRGSTSNTGRSGLGIFFERDY